MRPQFDALILKELHRRKITVVNIERCGVGTPEAEWQVRCEDGGKRRLVKVPVHSADTPVIVASAVARVLSGLRKESKRLSGLRFQIQILDRGKWRLAASSPDKMEIKSMLSAMGGPTERRKLVDIKDPSTFPPE